MAQKDTVDVLDVYDTGSEGTLNTAIDAKITAGTLSNTVFRLKPYGLYPLSGAVITPAGQTLEIIAAAPGATQLTAPPMICWTASTAPDKRYNFDVAGQLIMKNVWIQYASADGTRYGSSIRVGDSSSVSGGRCEFDNVIIDYSICPQNASGAVEIFATNFKGIFKNCYFRNCTDDHFRYYGRALSFRYSSTGLHADSVFFENCTFANAGYVYMQEGAEYGDNVFFNHCTFYNIVMFTLESGWWHKMYVTNSLFHNTFMFGAIPVNDGEGFGGTINIAPVDSFGFAVPFTEQDRRILFANNNYFVDQWLVDWMGWGPNGNPYSQDRHMNRKDNEIPVPMPMMNGDTRRFFDSTDGGGAKVFPYMNSANLDSLDPGFLNPPLNKDSLKIFLWYKWWNNADCNWAWKPANGYTQIWPVEESLTYTNAELKTAALGGFPLGDLYRWWPAEYASWKAQKDAEYVVIYNALENGDMSGIVSGIEPKPGGTVPSEYELSQNYPNPFNPTTQIDFSVPVSGFVSLKVYNSLGQVVATIFEGHQQAGAYTVTFDGSGLSSGVYLYQLQSGSVALTQKLVILK